MRMRGRVTAGSYELSVKVQVPSYKSGHLLTIKTGRLRLMQGANELGSYEYM